MEYIDLSTWCYTVEEWLLHQEYIFNYELSTNLPVINFNCLTMSAQNKAAVVHSNCLCLSLFNSFIFWVFLKNIFYILSESLKKHRLWLNSWYMLGIFCDLINTYITVTCFKGSDQVELQGADHQIKRDTLWIKLLS